MDGCLWGQRSSWACLVDASATTSDASLPTKIEAAQCNLATALDHHGVGICCFSGGKDSLALLELARPFAERIIVCWTNTQAAYPHMQTFILERLQDWMECGWRNRWVPVWRYVEQMGISLIIHGQRQADKTPLPSWTALAPSPCSHRSATGPPTMFTSIWRNKRCSCRRSMRRA